MAAISYDTYIDAQGFDTCEHMSESQFSDFWNDTPLWMFGTYLGGATGEQYGCTPIASSTLSYAVGLGYGVIPFWDGPQLGGACEMKNYSSTISLNTSTAYQEGESQADDAAAAASAEGYQEFDPVYYDLEAFYDASGCISAAESFINGWDYELNTATLYWGDVYGSECASYLSSFAHLGTVPKAIAPADQVHGTAGTTASVYGLSCVPDSYWDQDQRVRQYEDPPPSVTWSYNGSGSIYVDAECADSRVDSNYGGGSGSTITVNDCEYRY